MESADQRWSLRNEPDTAPPATAGWHCHSRDRREDLRLRGTARDLRPKCNKAQSRLECWCGLDRQTAFRISPKKHWANTQGRASARNCAIASAPGFEARPDRPPPGSPQARLEISRTACPG